MATHSSVLAWRIPGMVEPGGLPSMGSHRVRHDWSDLVVAAAYQKRLWCWERLKAGEEENRGWNGWMVSSIHRTWVWSSSRRWWRTGKTGFLQLMGCFLVLAIANSAINIEGTGLFFFFLIMVFSGYMPCSGIVGLYGNLFSLLRNLHDILHSSYINLHSFQKFKRVTLSPHPCQHLLLADILMMAIMSSVRWYFISFLIWTV